MTKHIEMMTAGKMLKDEFLDQFNLSVDELAQSISFPAWHITAIIESDYPMTAELDLLLTKYFGMSEGFFMRWQESYDFRRAKRQMRKKLAEIIPFAKLNRTAAIL